jgi:hypothetical protein
MVCKHCPARRHCFDKGSCESCAFGKAFENLYKKAGRSKAKIKELEAENKALKERLETLLHPDF